MLCDFQARPDGLYQKLTVQYWAMLPEQLIAAVARDLRTSFFLEEVQDGFKVVLGQRRWLSVVGHVSAYMDPVTCATSSWSSHC